MVLTPPTAQVRVVYGPKYPAGSVFDVVYSAQVKNPTQYTSHVVVYPETKPFSAGEVVSGECVEILRSREHGEIWATYSHLIHYLGHTKIRGVLGM
ncbi:hypothetical protein IG631_16768 [Alternaria alternata]|nr:hypothetical protein IG631_16768 [Alternaria alternata]